MTLNDELDAIVKGQPGVQQAMVMAFDGISVATASRGGDTERDSETVIESANLLRQYIKLFQEDRQANIREFVIRTDTHQYLFKPITDEYFLCVIMDERALFGKIRFDLDRRSPTIASAL